MKYFSGGRRGNDLHLQRQCHANALAVGIAPRRTDIIGNLRREALDRNIDRALEGDDQHIVGEAHAGVVVFAHVEDEARVAVVDGGRQRGLDRTVVG